MGEREELRGILERIKARVRVTKVTCTRTVKGKGGDSYVGFSAAFDSIQDDVGGLTDEHISSLSPEELRRAKERGLTLKESRLAALILGMQADMAAHDHAMAGGNITVEQRDEAARAIKNNYSRLMVEALNGSGKNGEKE